MDTAESLTLSLSLFIFFLAPLFLGNKVLQKFWSLAHVYIMEAKGFRLADIWPHSKVTL